MDFRQFAHAAARYKVVVVLAALLGLGLALAYSVLSPPMLTSTAQVEVIFPVSRSVAPIATQVLIAEGIDVLQAAGRSVQPPLPVSVMQQRIKVSELTPDVVGISASAQRASTAESLANAVAASYRAYISGHPQTAGGALSAQILEPASTTKGSLTRARVQDGLLGAVLGLLAGLVAALLLTRSDKRLRRRDEIADAIGIPVLASVPVQRPSDAAGWTRLLDSYQPAVVDAWSLRKALRQLGLTDFRGSGTADASLTVITLAGDKKALALGPQIAVFVASLGIPSALVVGPQQDPNATATLAAACGVTATRPAGRPFHMRLGAGSGRQPALEVAVAVVDDRAPDVSAAPRTSVTVLGVSTGAATAEQLARVAVNAANDGREIAGIIVADPDPTDPTTGRLPQPERATHNRMPTRMTGTTELR